MTEREIIEGCINKKYEYQKALFDVYAGKMMSVCLRYINDDQLAKDLLQEGFIKVFKVIEQYRFEGSFEGWLRRVFATTAIRYCSGRHHSFTHIDLVADDALETEPAVFSKLSEDEIHLLIRRLPDGNRTVFNLYVIEGYSHDDIAAILGIKASTSRVQLMKARKYLQELITNKFNQVRV